MPPVPDTDAAVTWLTAWAPDGPWLLTSIDPTADNPTVEAHSFTSLAHLIAYITKHNRTNNLYWMPNRATPHLHTTPSGRTYATTPRKEDVTHYDALYADVDLPRGVPHDEEHKAPLLARCRALVPPPTAIVDSGGGYQPVYKIDPAYPPTYRERIEATTKALCRELGSDAVQNVNRWLRLPGTVNIPTAAKAPRGRVPTIARVIDADWSRTWSYDDPVPRLPDDYHDDEPPPDALARRGFNDLPTKWQKLVKSGDASVYGEDRSSLVIALVMALVGRGWSDDEILPFLVEERYGSSAHCNSKPDPTATARRQIQRGRCKVASAWERTERGALMADSEKNVRRALQEMGVRLQYNEFTGRPTVGDNQYIDDAVGNHLRFTIKDKFGFRPGKDFFFDFAGELARENSFNPVKDYLTDRERKWDGKLRIDTWLIDYCHAEDSPLVRAIGRIVLIAAVRRIRQPGCKFDTILILVDPTQGSNKSTAVSALAIREEWFTDSLNINAKDQVVLEQVTGKWICELPELKGMRQSDIEHVKVFASRNEDSARMAYGRLPVVRKRQCIFIGTTNAVKFLKDETGNRRWWPIMVSRIDIDRLKCDVDQLWSEAAVAEATGESITLDETLCSAAADIQEVHRIEEPWVDVLGAELGDKHGKIMSVDVWKILGVETGRQTPWDNTRMGQAMKELGWTPSQRHFGTGHKQSAYAKGTPAEQKSIIYVFRDPVTRVVSVGHSPTAEDVPF